MSFPFPPVWFVFPLKVLVFVLESKKIECRIIGKNDIVSQSQFTIFRLMEICLFSTCNPQWSASYMVGRRPHRRACDQLRYLLGL